METSGIMEREEILKGFEKAWMPVDIIKIVEQNWRNRKGYDCSYYESFP